MLSGSLTNPEAMETIRQSERASSVPDLDLTIKNLLNGPWA